MIPRRTLAAVAAAFLALSLVAPPAAAALEDDARAFIQTLGDRVVHALSDPDLEGDARSERLRSLLDEATDWPQLSQLALGRPWRDLDADQQSTFTNAFRGYALRSLTANLREYDYSGETFTINAIEALTERDVRVTTRISNDTGPPLRVDWRVRNLGDHMILIDVVVADTSFIQFQRQQLQSVYNRQGFDGLIAELERHTLTGEDLGTG
jgi:phospholipid transport system substrate-binding protein